MTQLKTGAAVWLRVVVAAAFVASAMSQTVDLVVPSIPANQEDSPLANLWNQALRKQTGVVRSDEPTVKTYLAPNYVEVINWVPQDSAHPLYVADYQPLLREILRDYMVAAEVLPDDQRMTQPNGLTVTNLNGKKVTFKNTATGITVNNIPVEESKVNADGTVNYVLAESLFGHRERVNTAWEENNKKNPTRFGPLGRPLNPAPPPPPPTA
ncbi:uncharacterized protein LOC127007806 [Eriocheir sinensis]|uniref:uncharacterized protein LOC127007806 n=1 Tax=Eriocheir sinensis TaxID=95602 RepID=UPI0021CA8A6B|nr:uncharacterized protein LOC127007806 [Eriocheir sinensis]